MLTDLFSDQLRQDVLVAAAAVTRRNKWTLIESSKNAVAFRVTEDDETARSFGLTWNPSGDFLLLMYLREIKPPTGDQLAQLRELCARLSAGNPYGSFGVRESAGEWRVTYYAFLGMKKIETDADSQTVLEAGMEKSFMAVLKLFQFCGPDIDAIFGEAPQKKVFSA